MKKKFTVESYLIELNNVLKSIDQDSIKKCLGIIEKKIKKNKKIFICGNGGSATTANHMVTDLNKMVNILANKKFRGYSLSSNSGIITAYGNDMSFSDIFSEQLKSLMDKEDLLICISGSGKSKNIIKATRYANKIGGDTMALVGYDGGLLKNISKYCVHVKSFDMQICEDIHLMFNHMVMKFLTKGKIICQKKY